MTPALNASFRLPPLSREQFNGKGINPAESENRYRVALKMRAMQEIFLEAYSKCGSIGDAAEAAGINRHCHYRWSKDPDYRLAFKLADVQCLDSIEGKGKGLAIAGNVDLIKFFLRHGRPEIYAERLRIDSLDRAGLEALMARLFTKMGRPFDPEALDAEFSVASAVPDGGGLDRDGGDHPLGVSPPLSLEKGSPPSNDGTPAGPISPGEETP